MSTERSPKYRSGVFSARAPLYLYRASRSTSDRRWPRYLATKCSLNRPHGRLNVRTGVPTVAKSGQTRAKRKKGKANPCSRPYLARLQLRITTTQSVWAYATPNTWRHTVYRKCTKQEHIFAVCTGVHASWGTHLRPSWT